MLRSLSCRPRYVIFEHAQSPRSRNASSRRRSTCYVHQSSCYVHQSSCYVIRKLSEFLLRLMVSITELSLRSRRLYHAPDTSLLCHPTSMLRRSCVHAAFALDTALPTKILNMLRVHLEENLSSETCLLYTSPSPRD